MKYIVCDKISEVEHKKTCRYDVLLGVSVILGIEKNAQLGAW